MFLQHIQRTAGIYGFFARFIQIAKKKAGHELCWWETGRVCERRYRVGEQWYNFRPDAALGISPKTSCLFVSGWNGIAGRCMCAISLSSLPPLVTTLLRVNGQMCSRIPALASAERQSHAGAAQGRLQSRVEADLGGLARAAASSEPTAAGACLVIPRRLGRTAVSAVSPVSSCSHSSRLWLLLAQTVSPTSSCSSCNRRGSRKIMKHPPVRGQT